MTHRLYDTLREAHQWAHRHFEYVPDAKRWGLVEHYPTFEQIEEQLQKPAAIVRDDCDGFARLCQWRLKKAYDIEASLVTCLTEDNRGHMVCSVLGWVLDNKELDVRPREELEGRGYWFLLEGSFDGTWYRIKDKESK